MKAKKAQRHYTEDDMRLALQRYIDIEEHLHLPNRDDDQPADVLTDVIDEVLELRAVNEKVKAFVVSMNAQMQRR